MNLVDSSGWIEYFVDSTNADNYANAIEDNENLIVPTVCIIEVFKKILRETNEDNALLALAKMKMGKIIELDEQIAIDAAIYGIKYKLPLADSIIYATGQKYNAIIYTQDEHFKDLNNVKYFKK